MTLTESRTQTLRLVVLCVGAAFTAASVASLFAKGTLFYGAYKVDLFSQLVKCVMSAGFTLMIPYHYGSSLHKTGQARVKRQMPLRAGAGLMPAPTRGVVWRR